MQRLLLALLPFALGPRRRSRQAGPMVQEIAAEPAVRRLQPAATALADGLRAIFHNVDSDAAHAAISLFRDVARSGSSFAAMRRRTRCRARHPSHRPWEAVWTVVPVLIPDHDFDSIGRLLYRQLEIQLDLTIKAVGHRWY